MINKKMVILTVVFLVLTSIFPVFIIAGPKPRSFPPEWVGASGARITVGSLVSGSYTDTFYDDDDYHVIECDDEGLHDFEAIVFYEFAGKCSKVKILADDEPHTSVERFTAKAYYTDETSVFLGSFTPNELTQFNLNPNKLLDEIRIRYCYDNWNPPEEILIEVDYISAYWTGIL